MRLAFSVLALMLAGCVSRDERQVNRNAPGDHPAAYQAGRTAHELARNTGRVAESAARKLAREAKAMGQGWKEQAREDRAKNRGRN